MKFTAFALILIALFAAVFADQNVYDIDNFDIESATVVIVTPTGGVTSSITSSNFVTGSMFSGERDLTLVVESGPQNQVFATSVLSDYEGSAPSQGNGYSFVQYDGTDGSSNINTSGAFSDSNNDFTSGSAYAFHLVIQADQDTTVDIYVYSGGSTSDYCQTTLTIPGDQTTHDYFPTYTSFSKKGNGCDFTNVGALELLADLPSNVDITISTFATYGPTVAVTPTPTPTISRSATPSAAPSGTRSPSPSPSSNPCVCECKAFHCVLEYDPSGVNTFYFSESALQDDDNTSHTSRFSSGNNGSSSDAGIVSVSLAMIAALIVILI